MVKFKDTNRVSLELAKEYSKKYDIWTLYLEAIKETASEKETSASYYNEKLGKYRSLAGV